MSYLYNRFIFHKGHVIKLFTLYMSTHFKYRFWYIWCEGNVQTVNMRTTGQQKRNHVYINNNLMITSDMS